MLSISKCLHILYSFGSLENIINVWGRYWCSTGQIRKQIQRWLTSARSHSKRWRQVFWGLVRYSFHQITQSINLIVYRFVLRNGSIFLDQSLTTNLAFHSINLSLSFSRHVCEKSKIPLVKSQMLASVMLWLWRGVVLDIRKHSALTILHQHQWFDLENDYNVNNLYWYL